MLMVSSFLLLIMGCASLEMQTWLPSVSPVLPASLEEPQSEAQEGFLGFLTRAVVAEHWLIQRGVPGVLCGLWGVAGSLSWVILDKRGWLGFLSPRTTSSSVRHFILPVPPQLYQCCNSFAEQVTKTPPKNPFQTCLFSLPLHPAPKSRRQIRPVHLEGMLPHLPQRRDQPGNRGRLRLLLRLLPVQHQWLQQRPSQLHPPGLGDSRQPPLHPPGSRVMGLPEEEPPPTGLVSQYPLCCCLQGDPLFLSRLPR